jgi:hypothetical protein
MAKRKVETHTAGPLKAKQATVRKKPGKAGVEPETDPVKVLLDKLYSLAIDDENTTAAKIYLDHTLKLKGEDPEALTPDEALRILRERKA